MPSKVISLGEACLVKHNMIRFIGKEETHLFDWVTTRFDTVIYILKNIHDTTLFSKNKFQGPIKDKNYGGDKNCHVMCIYEPFFFRSVHDFPKNIPYMERMDENIEKFTRRQERLKDTIITSDVIHFIHCMSKYSIITPEKIELFKQYLYDICPSNTYYLHIAIPPECNFIDKDSLSNESVFIYELYEVTPNNNTWQREGYNWSDIFDNIKRIDSSNEI